MTEYDFLVVKMIKINAHVLRCFHLNNARTGRVSALWCEKDKSIDFCHLHVNKIIFSPHSYMSSKKQKWSVVLKFYFEIKLNYKNNLILSEIQFSMITATKIDHTSAALICARYILLHDTMMQSCILTYQWMSWNWFVPVPQQLPLATFAHTY